MKMLKKLALVSAVSMISAGAFAMEAMDDESMAEATGQDGITILVSPATRTTSQLTALGVQAATQTAIDVGGTAGTFKGLSITQVVIHDDDGWTVAGGGTANTANSGAIVIGGNAAGADLNGDTVVDALDTALDSTVVFADDTTPISIQVDAVGDHDNNATSSPMLNVRIDTPTLGIKVGRIYVADSNAADGATTDTDTDGTTATAAVQIMSGMEIIMGATTMNIQLGNETQGGMIAMNAALTGGLAINDFLLNDANSGGSISVNELIMKDAGGTDLNVGVVVNAVAAGPAGDGLYVTLTQFGDAVNGADLTLNDVNLGDASTANTTNIGDVQIKGLSLAGTTLIIRGH